MIPLPRRAAAALAAGLALVLAAPAVARAQDGAAAPALRRFALVAGVNDGGPGRPRLHYAVSDATRVAHVLQQVGGVAPGDTLLLADPGEAALRGALGDLAAQVQRARGAGRIEVVFYYSGHSDEEGLLVRGARVPYADLRRWLEALSADVRIAILDSCSSGAFTRGKGGQRAAPFLVDTSTRVTGQVILTSAAADEAAQESDRIGASFFTHYLVTGLRGAADASGDGKVTLSEVYQFAFHETLARTERTRSGPQHAEWDIALVGAGDVVLTDLHGGGATLVLPEALAGRLFVRDAGERLVAELRKVAGQPVELALDPGEYRVTREQGGKLVEAKVAVPAATRTPLLAALFTPVPRELTALRGDEPADLASAPLDLAIFPPMSLNGDRAVVNRVQLGLIASRTTRLRGVGIAPVLWADEDVRGLQLAYVGNSARGDVAGVQLSLIANVSGSLSGFQSTIGLNVVRGDVWGVQGSTFGNWAGGQVTGLQSSTIMNYAGAITGLQLAVASVAGELTGAQIGLVNVGGDVHGAQVGLVNVARRAHGAQVGLVNVADELEGAPVGLLSLVANGEQRLLALVDADGMMRTELLLGSRTFHTLWTGAFQQTGGSVRVWTGFGLGAHLAVRERLFADVDVIGQTVPGDGSDLLGTIRALAGWQATEHLAVVAGPTLNVFLSDGLDAGVGGALSRELDVAQGNVGRVWLGFVVGTRL
jgi:hypothetical protein